MTRRQVAGAAGLALIALAGLAMTDAAGPDRVVRVPDGDTLVLAGGALALWADQPVRLDGIDAAEMRSRCPEEWLMARAARGAVRARLWLAGGRPRVAHSGRLDKYGRELVRVAVPGWGPLGPADLTDWLVALGLGRDYHGERRQSWCNLLAR